MARRMQDLRSDLSIHTIGQEFLELRLRGSQAKGLGDDLRAITALFLETLVAQEVRSSAPSLIVAQYKRDLAQAEARKEQAEQRLALADKRDRALPGQVHAQAAEVSSSDSERSLGIDVATAQSEIAARKRDLQEAEAIYSKYTAAGVLGLLNAPERIVVVDPPADPSFPKFSRRMLMAGGLAALVALGFLLALIAELTDPLIRQVSDFEHVSGLPVVARLPRARWENGAAAPSRRWYRSRLRYVTLFLIIVALTAVAMNWIAVQQLIGALASWVRGLELP